MENPIKPNFDWSSLYQKYDSTCKRFESEAPYLYAINSQPANDRYLYYEIVNKIKHEKHQGIIGLGTYEAIMYWKLYSQPAAVANVCKKIRRDEQKQEIIQSSLRKFSRNLPATVNQDIKEVEELFQVLQSNSFGLYGLSDSCAIPVRSTLLHFIFPKVIPIFDKQVLLAVGVYEKGANKKYPFLYDYIKHVWQISEESNIPKNWKEPPIRLIDMALWVKRNKLM